MRLKKSKILVTFCESLCHNFISPNQNRIKLFTNESLTGQSKVKLD